MSKKQTEAARKRRQAAKRERAFQRQMAALDLAMNPRFRAYLAVEYQDAYRRALARFRQDEEHPHALH